MDFVNNEWADGVIFCRGPDLASVFLDEDCKKPVAGSSVDASPGKPASSVWGEGVPRDTTLALNLQVKGTFTLYLKGDGMWKSGACWFQDTQSNARESLVKGPQFQSQVEFTIQRSGHGNVWFDLSSVEGVSGGLTMSYTPDDDPATGAKAVTTTAAAFPGKPSKLKIEMAPRFGFPTVVSDKHMSGASCDCGTYSPTDPACNTASCLAACPGVLVDNACGQHACRVWYAEQYANKDSYCGWLFADGAQTYCWAMDEWVCADGRCGWGGTDQPEPMSCSDVDGMQANSYSCGHGMNLQSNDGGRWWTQNAGCTDKHVNGVPTNPAPFRSGGVIHITFDNLPWLHEASS